MASMMMKNYLHFTGGDSLLFETWTATSSGAIAGACIGLVVVALFERWLYSIRAGLEAYWRQRILALYKENAEDEGTSSIGDKASSQVARRNRTVTPFIAAHDVPRGVIHALQALLGYILMLAVMTFQAAYVISIVLGLGIGEILFGRMNARNLLH